MLCLAVGDREQVRGQDRASSALLLGFKSPQSSKAGVQGGDACNGAAWTADRILLVTWFTALGRFCHTLGSVVCALSGQSDRISWPSGEVGLVTWWCFNHSVPLSTGNSLFLLKIKFWQWGFASVEIFIFGIMELLTLFFPTSLRSGICILCYPRLSWCNPRENT